MDRADVVDQDVEAAERGDRLVDQPPRSAGAAQVHRDGMDREGGGELGQVVGDFTGSGHHAHALVGQRPCHGQADAFAGAGDHGDLARQVQVRR